MFAAPFSATLGDFLRSMREMNAGYYGASATDDDDTLVVAGFVTTVPDLAEGFSVLSGIHTDETLTAEGGALEGLPDDLLRRLVADPLPAFAFIAHLRRAMHEGAFEHSPQGVPDFFRHWFAATGEHMMLTEEGWTAADEYRKQPELLVEVQDEINAPPGGALWSLTPGYIEGITITGDRHSETIAVLPDGRRLVIEDLDWEMDEDGAHAVGHIRHENGREITDEETDEFDPWLTDLYAELLNADA